MTTDEERAEAILGTVRGAVNATHSELVTYVSGELRAERKRVITDAIEIIDACKKAAGTGDQTVKLLRRCLAEAEEDYMDYAICIQCDKSCKERAIPGDYPEDGEVFCSEECEAKYRAVNEPKPRGEQ